MSTRRLHNLLPKKHVDIVQVVFIFFPKYFSHLTEIKQENQTPVLDVLMAAVSA